MTEPIRLVICGSRDIRDHEYFTAACDEYLQRLDLAQNPIILSGMAQGVDRMAVKYAEDNNYELVEHPANWKDFTEPCLRRRNNRGEYNALAGHNRNQRMCDDCTHVLGIHRPNSPGTLDMLRRAHRANRIVHHCVYPHRQIKVFTP